jgi:hypothetical protein
MSHYRNSFYQNSSSGSKTGHYAQKPSNKSPDVYTSGVYSPFTRLGEQNGKYTLASQSSQVLLSNYGTFNPEFIIKEIKKQSSGKGLYILGIKYRRIWNSKKNKMDGGNCQLTVTGTLIPGESFNDGMLRELREEVGGNIDDIATLSQFFSLKDGRTFKTYFINVTSLSKIPESEKSKTYSKESDRSKKVEMAIVGTLDEFQMFFDRVDCRLNDDDNIDGCVLFSYDDFIKHCGVLKISL